MTQSSRRIRLVVELDPPCWWVLDDLELHGAVGIYPAPEWVARTSGGPGVLQTLTRQGLIEPAGDRDPGDDGKRVAISPRASYLVRFWIRPYLALLGELAGPVRGLEIRDAYEFADPRLVDDLLGQGLCRTDRELADTLENNPDAAGRLRITHRGRNYIK